MKDDPDWLEQIEHTADVGIIVRADDRKELFARAAWGMFSLITEVHNVEPRHKSRVSVEAADQEALMVKWLSELNFLHVTEHRLFSEFKVHEVDEERLSADVGGERIDPKRHVIHTEIKAVTFHGLTIRKDGDRWKAEIIFDL